MDEPPRSITIVSMSDARRLVAALRLAVDHPGIRELARTWPIRCQG
jgi:hypothetical protein